MWETVWNSLISGNVIEAILLALMGVIIVLIKLILLPLGFLLQTFIPSLDNGLLKISEMFVDASTYLSWALSLVGIPSEVILIVTSYYTLILTTAVMVWSFKLGILWYRAIK